MTLKSKPEKSNSVFAALLAQSVSDSDDLSIELSAFLSPGESIEDALDLLEYVVYEEKQKLQSLTEKERLGVSKTW